MLPLIEYSKPCKTSKMKVLRKLEAVKYFRKTVHDICLTGF